MDVKPALAVCQLVGEKRASLMQNASVSLVPVCSVRFVRTPLISYSTIDKGHIYYAHNLIYIKMDICQNTRFLSNIHRDNFPGQHISLRKIYLSYT